MTQKTIEFEDFAREYFNCHCRQDEGFTWAELNEGGRQFWRMKAHRMWVRLGAPSNEEENAA